MTNPDPELAAWLRRQREQRGWDHHEMARRLIQAAHDNGDPTVPAADHVLRNIQRWERRGIVSRRYQFHYCRAFGIGPDQFGKPDPEPRDAAPAPQATALAVPVLSPGIAVPGMVDPLLPSSPMMT